MGIILQKLGLKKKKNIEIDIQNNIENIKEKELELINNVVKVHICGESKVKEKILQLFKSEITNPDYKSKGDYEYKTNDFYWIIKIHKYKLLTSKECNELEEIIEEDKTCNEGKIKHHILLLLGDNNDIKVILEEFTDINRPRIIFVTEKKQNFENFRKKKEVKNIIYEGLNDNELNNYIISSLWELDCYFNEKGNEIFRYSPKNIAKELQTDNSFFSINILLTGMCRSGKSTFINVMSEKLVALETNDTESVTLKVSEYFIYRNDDKKEHGAIKLMDSPGICEDNNVNTKVKKKIQYFLENKEKKIENQIHFILFFFMEQSTLGNANELLKLLNESKYPVFFIINKSQDHSWKGKSQDIKSKINFFRRNGYNRFVQEDIFIQVNIKSINNKNEFYGIDDIFKKIKKYIDDNKLLDEKIYENMCGIQTKYYRSLISTNEEYNFHEEMSKLYESFENNILFKNINLENMKNHGRQIANKYEKTIILLSNLKDVFPETFNKMPIITFLQSYMVKEIGGGYGFDFDRLNYCFKKFNKDIKDLNINKIKKQNLNNEEIRVYNINEISGQRDEITSTINEIEKNTDEEVINNIAQTINEFTSNDKESQENKNKINIENTHSISHLCQIYFEKELDNSNGIYFLIYFFNKNKSLMNDIDYYINKKDWEKDEMEFIEK